MKKVTLICALAIFGAFAANAKTTETKSETPAEVKSEAKTTFEYWVVSKDGDQYQLSSNSSNNANCGLGSSEPCKITTTVEHSDLQISEDEVLDAGQTTINSRRDL